MRTYSWEMYASPFRAHPLSALRSLSALLASSCDLAPWGVGGNCRASRTALRRGVWCHPFPLRRAHDGQGFPDGHRAAGGVVPSAAAVGPGAPVGFGRFGRAREPDLLAE